MSRLLPLVLVAGLSLTPAVFAASDPMDACSKETNDSARLACFDKALAARRQAPAAPAAATPVAPAAPTAPAAASGTNVASPATNTAPPLPADLGKPPVRPAKAKPIEYSATLTKVDTRSSTGYLLTLDNGQVWQTTEAHSDLLLNEQDTVTIKPAGAGGFLLKTPRKQIVRVVRVR